MADLVYNFNGELVRKAVQRPIIPPIVRFFDSIEEIDCGLSAPCWLWRSKRDGEPMLRISRRIRKRPWRYAFELYFRSFVPSGANWDWNCPNRNLCCQPEHLKMIGIYCQDRPVSAV